jgi:VWFA-related protein
MNRNISMVKITALLLALGLCGVASAFGQEPAAQVYTERIEVRILNLEAVVTDRDGERVPELQPEDFRLLVDGEEVPIEFFSEVRDGTIIASDQAVPGLVADQESGTSFLIFIDEFFAIKADKNRVLKSIADRIPNLRENDQAAVVAWNGKGIDVLSGWSGSAEELAGVMEEAIKRPSYGLQRESERKQWNVTLSPQDQALAARRQRYDPYRLGTQERMYADILVGQLSSTVGAASAAMRGLAVPQGRKVLVLLSGGWPMEVDDFVGRSTTRFIHEPNIPEGVELYGPLAITANLLGYTIYSVDMPGLQQSSGADASLRGPQPRGTGSAAFFMEGEIHHSLQFLAADTGGLALINGARVKTLNEVGNDVRSYYWLGFSPQWAGDNERRAIEVEVTNPDLRVRTRSGYYDLSPQAQVAMAVESSMLFGPSEGSKELTVELGEFEKTQKKLMAAPLRIALPASALTAVPSADGWTIQLDLFIAALDSSGARSDVPATPLVFSAKKKPRPQDTVGYETTLQVRRKTEIVAVAVYDRNGGVTYSKSLAVGK